MMNREMQVALDYLCYLRHKHGPPFLDDAADLDKFIALLDQHAAEAKAEGYYNGKIDQAKIEIQGKDRFVTELKQHMKEGKDKFTNKIIAEWKSIYRDRPADGMTCKSRIRGEQGYCGECTYDADTATFRTYEDKINRLIITIWKHDEWKQHSGGE